MPIVVSQPVAQVPSGDAESPDGKIRATVMPDAAGVFIRVDYRSMLDQVGYEWPNPFRMTIYRQTADGVVMPVRGADSISQYGAVVHAYDDEVKFGALVTYWAEAPTQSGDEIVETDKVVVKTWEPDGGFTSPGVWIKNLEDPDLSVPARCLDWSAGSWASRNATADIWGGASPAVTTDVRKSYNTKMVILTKDEDEYQALLQAVDSSVVYIVGLERHRRRTGYYLIGDIAPTRVGRVDSPYDMWEVNLTGMDRPSSSGHSLAVPGRSYADRKRQYETYQLVADAESDQPWNYALNPSVEVDLTNILSYAQSSRTRDTTNKMFGTASLRNDMTANGSGGAQFVLGRTFGEGETITVSAWYYCTVAQGNLFFSFRNASTTLGITSMGPAPVLNSWFRTTGSYVVPAGQTCDRVAIAFPGLTGQVFWTDGITVSAGSAAPESYYDGDSEGAVWTGTPHASASRRVRQYQNGTEPY